MLYLALPAHNEADTIGVLLWRIRTVLAEFPREYEVVVYDDGSTDVTREVLASYTQVMPLTVLHGERPIGYAGALDALVRHVVRQTRYPRRDALLLLQGDFTDPPGLIPEFARRFEGGADLVVGERTAVVDAPVPVKRLFTGASLVLRPFVRAAGITDLTSSMRLVRLSLLRDLLRSRGDAPVCQGDTVTANADLLLDLVPLARRVETVPVEPTYGVRMRGTRHVAMRDLLAALRWAWRARGRRVAPSLTAAAGGDGEPARGRVEERGEGRSDGRGDGRSGGRGEGRGEGRGQGRRDARTTGRGEEARGGRARDTARDGRPARDDRPRREDRLAEPVVESRADARTEGRTEGRGDAQGDRPQGRQRERTRGRRERGGRPGPEGQPADGVPTPPPTPPPVKAAPLPLDDPFAPPPPPRDPFAVLDAPAGRPAEGASTRRDDEVREPVDADAADGDGPDGNDPSEAGESAESAERRRRRRRSRRGRGRRGSGADEAQEPEGTSAGADTDRDDAGRGVADDGDHERTPRDGAGSDDATGAEAGPEQARARRRGRRGRRGGARRTRRGDGGAEGGTESGGDAGGPGDGAD